MRITRIKDVSSFENPPINKIDGFYYYNSGVSECGGSPSNNSNTITNWDLREAFRIYGVKKEV